ncbi:sarcolemmal membrane-associated protein isoform X1 [Anastrepha ludens]|uniref:sarcolemmal membrane-associated protein isoform X1 n=2 Tax=Anastrepha ludens TaxID=28586 RepID=UPI0023B06966|nr:sarcolemmal membrane-associated protein isoform X1 [Anastrepha ludens]
MRVHKVTCLVKTKSMVLASNEWLNSCEDEQKTTSGNSQPATSTTATTPATEIHEGAGPTTEVTSTTNTTTTANPNTPPTLTTALIASAYNEIMSENRETHHPQQQQQQQQQQPSQNKKNSINDALVAPVSLNDVNTPTAQEIVNNNSEVLNCDTSNVTSNSNANNTNANSNINDSISDNSGGVGDAGMNANIGISNNANNTNLYSNPNSNASTLQSAIVRQSKGSTVTIGTAQPGGLMPLRGPITAQALSTALQSAMNLSNNTKATSGPVVGNLQNNFLGTLDLDMGAANIVSLQHTVKEISSSICSAFVEAQSNITNNASNPVQNVGTSGNISMNMEATENNGQAKIVLLCEANSHPFQTRTIFLMPNIECKVGRLIAKSKASESNAIFDCKVLSRNHAVLWYTDDGKFWVKDTKSSNGTFINENKLGTEAAELHFGDIVKFGVDVLENSRKEVHGCIIAFVKLYLPDGREAISIDTTTQRSQYSGEGRISYEEMHRLNLYMQEVSQREKALKSKLFNIQNVLDATRKNSALCWQSLIAEDQLLHRINSLEKKLQIMEKNVPESVLRNEVLKLLEDKNSYQLTAKEALRKVYQERCDALQMLSKMELAYANSDGECKILRDQIMNTKQSLQDVNTRLQRLETDYNEYKEEAERKQQEIKEQEELRIAEMMEKLQLRELECDDLRRRVSEFMLQRAELVDEEEKQLQLQAIEKLDAVIGDMDLGEDDDDDDDDDDEDDNSDVKGDEGDGEHKEDGNEKDGGKKALRKSAVAKGLEAMNGVEAKIMNSSNEKEVLNISSKSEVAQKKCKQKGSAKESTILKWLQNSDLNQKEGSIDIFKAICNESDSSDEPDLPAIENDAVNVDSESGIDTNTTSAEEIKLKCKKSKNKLQSVQAILCQLVETEMAKECYKSSVAVEHNDEENEALKLSGNEEGHASTNDDQRLVLLKRSVAMLSEAYKELCDSLNEKELHKSFTADVKEKSPQLTSTAQTQFENYAPLNTSGGSAVKRLSTQDTLKPLAEAVEDEVPEFDLRESNLQPQHKIDEECTTAVTTPSTIVSPGDIVDKAMSISEEVFAYQQQIKELNQKLEQVECDAQNTLEIMQIECDTFKEKVTQLTKVVQKECEEKQELEKLLEARSSMEKVHMPIEQSTEQRLDAATAIKMPLSGAAVPEASANDKASELHDCSGDELRAADKENSTSGKLDADFEAQLHDDLVAINSNALEREEELIVYKERLEKTQNDNLQLRNEIATLLLKSGTQAQTHMVKQLLAYGTVVVAIIVYFITMYF